MTDLGPEWRDSPNIFDRDHGGLVATCPEPVRKQRQVPNMKVQQEHRAATLQRLIQVFYSIERAPPTPARLSVPVDPEVGVAGHGQGHPRAPDPRNSPPASPTRQERFRHPQNITERDLAPFQARQFQRGRDHRKWQQDQAERRHRQGPFGDPAQVSPKAFTISQSRSTYPGLSGAEFLRFILWSWISSQLITQST